MRILGSVICFLIASSTLQAGLISFWDAEGNANDSIDGNDGTIFGGVVFTPGIDGQSFDFDGSAGTRIEIADAPNLRFADSFTLAAWVNTTNPGTPGSSGSSLFADILRKRNRDNGGLMDIGIGMRDGNARFYLFDDTGSTDLGLGIQGTSTINDGEWHHIAGVRDASNNLMHLYVDGMLEASLATTTGTFQEVNATPWNIGNNPGTAKSPWSDLIDDVRIYDHALSTAEVQTLAAVPEPSTFALLTVAGIAFGGYQLRRKRGKN